MILQGQTFELKLKSQRFKAKHLINNMNNETDKQIEEIRSRNGDKTIGFTCSCFDMLHAGHMLMLKDAKEHCDILVIGLQTDPTIDRPTKNKPIMSYKERTILVQGVKYIDEIIPYTTEDDLLAILKGLNPNIRILGTDYIDKKFTGCQLSITIYWHDRFTHDYSSTAIRERVYKAEKLKKITKENNK